MNKVKPNQPLFDLHLEYSAKATEQEKEYRYLEGKFALIFGYLPILIEDETFPYLTEKQQDACGAFWRNKKVITARTAMITSRTLAKAYFDAFVDSGNK